VLILSKGLTGGYLPLAATLATDEIYDAFLGEPWAGRTFYHGHTYTGNPLACAAALASLKRIESQQVLANVERIAEIFDAWSRDQQVRWANNVLIRQKGAMLGIELFQNANAGVPFSPELRVGHQATLECRRRGMIVRNIGDVLVLMPAPAMPVDLVRRLCGVAEESIEAVL
jgi:adenosylmethionine-8-amino-7-oxononanoate aminotransferase